MALRLLEGLIKLLEVNLETPTKTTQFHDKLSALVMILFAVVFGVGLAELGKVSDFYDGSVLLLAYTAIILSWWGYHYATVQGPSETNALNYAIDYVLLAVYWFLIDQRTILSTVLILYLFMFLLYTAWEFVRKVKTEDTRTAKSVELNLTFSLLILFLWVLHSFKAITLSNGGYVAILFVTIIGYRLGIRHLYRSSDGISFSQEKIAEVDMTLVEKAASVAAKARNHLSGFPVGAAVLADSGRTYVGCNIEFDNYSNTIHAEEAAISAAVVAGEKRIVSIAIFTSTDSVYYPCGMCRQSLFELGGKDLRVIACGKNSCEVKTIAELLPSGFHL